MQYLCVFLLSRGGVDNTDMHNQEMKPFAKSLADLMVKYGFAHEGGDKDGKPNPTSLATFSKDRIKQPTLQRILAGKSETPKKEIRIALFDVFSKKGATDEEMSFLNIVAHTELSKLSPDAQLVALRWQDLPEILRLQVTRFIDNQEALVKAVPALKKPLDRNSQSYIDYENNVGVRTAKARQGAIGTKKKPTPPDKTKR